jgi:hypothetical protein
MIFFWKTYTATVTGSTNKHVVCETCDRGFDYVVTEQGKGHSDSWFCLDNQGAERRASNRAVQDCERRLTRAMYILPCPNCGWYQRVMVKRGKGKRLLYTALLGLPASFIALCWQFFGAPQPLSWLAQSLPTIVFFGFPIMGIVWFFVYDPNRRKGEPVPVPSGAGSEQER